MSMELETGKLRVLGLEIEVRKIGKTARLDSGIRGLPILPVISWMNKNLRNERLIELNDGSLLISGWLPRLPSRAFSRLIEGELRRRILRKRIPQTLSIEPTKQCPLDCEHCVSKKREGEELSLEEIERVCREAQEMGVVVVNFTEGEPTMKDGFLDLASKLDTESSAVNVFTTGYGFDSGFARALKRAGFQTVFVSLYSHEPDEHDRIRRREGAWETAVGAIEKALRAGLVVTVATHVDSRDIRSGKIERLYEFVRDLGAHELSIWEKIPKPGSSSPSYLTDDDRRYLLSFQKRMNSLDRDPEDPRVFYSGFFEYKLVGCMAGTRWMHITSVGDVQPCVYMPLSFGNVRRDGLRNCWRKMGREKWFRGERFCLLQREDFRKFVSIAEECC